MPPRENLRRSRAVAERAARLVGNYRPLPGVSDELIGRDGRIRPHWQRFVQTMAELGGRELQHRFSLADRHLAESGVVLRVYGAENGDERPWPLAHVPFLIAPEEWRQLEAGLIQRARLLDAVLGDAYGEGRLAADGALPASIIAGSPEFLRPLVGSEPVGGHHLRIYAVDVGRGPDGDWWVVSDRTQAPSGAGYALENRIALAQALPDIYRAFNVERLAGFFQAFRAGLNALNRHEETRVALLTPGPLNETYFEHAYLARYLGFVLVEGEDLTVRDDTVYMRTITGLKRTDVLLRRLDADFADPLELNPASRLGVPGLAGAVRRRNVVIANALGSGVVEARAMMGFLPGLSERILGEKLILPNVDTWWCGQTLERDHVVAEFDRVVIAPALAPTLPGILSRGPVLGANLSPEDKAKLIDAISRRGQDYVGQEAVTLSTTPVWRGEGEDARLEPRPSILRLYVAQTADGWKVMPGGFCRISDRADARAVTLQQGGTSADVWVLSDGPVAETTLLASPDKVALRRATSTLPSRAAENLFWLGRYVERTEQALRVVFGAERRGGEGATQRVEMLAAVGGEGDQKREITVVARTGFGELQNHQAKAFGEVEGEARQRLEREDHVGEIGQGILQRAEALESRLLAEGGFEVGAGEAAADQLHEECVGRRGDGRTAAPEQADFGRGRDIGRVEIGQQRAKPGDEIGDLARREIERACRIGRRHGIDEARPRDAVLEGGRAEVVGEPFGETAQDRHRQRSGELQHEEEHRDRGRRLARSRLGEEMRRIEPAGRRAHPEQQQEAGTDRLDQDVDVAELPSDAGETAGRDEAGDARAEIGADDEEEAVVELDKACAQPGECEDGGCRRGLRHERHRDADDEADKRRQCLGEGGQRVDIDGARRGLDEVDAEKEQREAEQDAHPVAQRSPAVEAGLIAETDEPDEHQRRDMEIDRRHHDQRRRPDIAAGDDRDRIAGGQRATAHEIAGDDRDRVARLRDDAGDAADQEAGEGRGGGALEQHADPAAERLLQIGGQELQADKEQPETGQQLAKARHVTLSAGHEAYAAPVDPVPAKRLRHRGRASPVLRRST